MSSFAAILEQIKTLFSFATIFTFLKAYHLAGMFGMLLACGFGLPMPEDIILIAGGALAALQQDKLWPSIVVAYAGVIIGDATVFTIGRRYGYKLLENPTVMKVFTAARRDRVQGVFRRWGPYAVFAGRFAAGVRSFVFLTAGAMKVPYAQFLIYDTLAAVVSVPLFIYIGYAFGENYEVVLHKLGSVQKILFLVVGIGVLIWLVRRVLSKKKAAALPKVSAATDESIQAPK